MSRSNLVDKIVAVFSPKKGLERAYDRRLLNKYNAALPRNPHTKKTNKQSKGNANGKRKGNDSEVTVTVSESGGPGARLNLSPEASGIDSMFFDAQADHAFGDTQFAGRLGHVAFAGLQRVKDQLAFGDIEGLT